MTEEIGKLDSDRYKQLKSEHTHALELFLGSEKKLVKKLIKAQLAFTRAEKDQDSDIRTLRKEFNNLYSEIDEKLNDEKTMKRIETILADCRELVNQSEDDKSLLQEIKALEAELEQSESTVEENKIDTLAFYPNEKGKLERLALRKIILVEVRKYEDEESILLLVKVVEGNHGELGLETKELIIKLPKRKKRIQPQVSSQQQTTTKIELPPTRAEDQYNEECSQCAVKIDGKDNYFVEYEGYACDNCVVGLPEVDPTAD
ncbi:10309_t:CDS:2 [Racocetra fulgida]|uniref:10309_t:CDS:1 n=1 Tax=Racocetra fulgida TaxID=60492 RepID=A0A9N8W633_9GLOM|nr:10309_t:CDS:2 [Racocetra fulgida]